MLYKRLKCQWNSLPHELGYTKKSESNHNSFNGKYSHKKENKNKKYFGTAILLFWYSVRKNYIYGIFWINIILHLTVTGSYIAPILSVLWHRKSFWTKIVNNIDWSTIVHGVMLRGIIPPGILTLQWTPYPSRQDTISNRFLLCKVKYNKHAVGVISDRDVYDVYVTISFWLMSRIKQQNYPPH